MASWSKSLGRGCAVLLLVACSDDPNGELPTVAGSGGSSGALPANSGAGATGGSAGQAGASAQPAGGRSGSSSAAGTGGASPADAGPTPIGGDGGEPGDAAIDERDGAMPDGQERWVTTWGTALIDLGLFATVVFDDVTVRQVVHTSVAGDRTRVRFSNAFGTEPLVIGAAHVALHDTGSSIVAASDQPLTFQGSASVTIAAGQQVTSDAIAFAVPALGDLAISVDFPEPTLAQTVHSTAIQTLYVADRSGVAGAAQITSNETYPSWAFLEAVDVETAAATPAVVAFGDSITDGYMATENANQRWPDELARRLAAGGKQRAVVNEGFSGNQVLAAGAGDAALVRFERDVLANAGVKHVIVLEGINDIGLSGATTEALLAGYRQLIDKAHGAGLEIIFGTICPFEGAAYYSAEGEATRSALNEWIRSSDAHDGFVDFDQAVRDPSSPKRLLPAHDSGDFLHPSDAGYKAMGAAVDLALLE